MGAVAGRVAGFGVYTKRFIDNSCCIQMSDSVNVNVITELY